MPSHFRIRTFSLTLATLLGGGLIGLQAADVTQIANSGSDWNNTAYWGATASSGNNYFSTSSGTLTNELVVDGRTWSFAGTIGTVRDNLSGSGSFNGDSLTIVSDSRLLGKVQNGGTSTVNLIFGGGFYMSGVNSGNGSATLAGSISFASGIDFGAIAVNPNTGATAMNLTVSSTVIGDSSDTLQLTLFSEGATAGAGTRLGNLIFNGDISGFGGTIYVGTAVSGTNTASTYSIRSSSLVSTIRLDTTSTNFNYDLAGVDVTFGSLILGTSTPVGNGTYDAAALNSLAGGSFFTGTGSITVVPEPTTVSLTIVALLGGVILFRSHGRRAKASARM